MKKLKFWRKRSKNIHLADNKLTKAEIVGFLGERGYDQSRSVKLTLRTLKIIWSNLNKKDARKAQERMIAEWSWV